MLLVKLHTVHVACHPWGNMKVQQVVHCLCCMLFTAVCTVCSVFNIQHVAAGWCWKYRQCLFVFAKSAWNRLCATLCTSIQTGGWLTTEIIAQAASSRLFSCHTEPSQLTDAAEAEYFPHFPDQQHWPYCNANGLFMDIYSIYGTTTYHFYISRKNATFQSVTFRGVHNKTTSLTLSSLYAKLG